MNKWEKKCILATLSCLSHFVGTEMDLYSRIVFFLTVYVISSIKEEHTFKFFTIYAVYLWIIWLKLQLEVDSTLTIFNV